VIIVFEPLCVGPEHVEVNAALLSVARLVFPGRPIVFCAEGAHLSLVAGRVGRAARVRFVRVRIPERLLPPLQRFAWELSSFRRLLRFAGRVGASALIFASIAPEGLIARSGHFFKRRPR
jgi:hypothetical protein